MKKKFNYFDIKLVLLIYLRNTIMIHINKKKFNLTTKMNFGQRCIIYNVCIKLTKEFSMQRKVF